VKNILILFAFIITGIFNIQAQNYSDFLKLKPTHEIKSESLLASLQELLFDNEIFGQFESDIVVIKVEKEKSESSICVSKTDFVTFKDYRPDFFEQLKGYADYKGLRILLFGEMNEELYRKLDTKFYDIIGPSPVYTKDFPPTVYEPKIVCFKN